MNTDVPKRFRSGQAWGRLALMLVYFLAVFEIALLLVGLMMLFQFFQNIFFDISCRDSNFHPFPSKQARTACADTRSSANDQCNFCVSHTRCFIHIIFTKH